MQSDEIVIEDEEQRQALEGSKHGPRICANFMLTLREQMTPFRDWKSIPKMGLLDPANPAYPKLCDRYKIAALSKLECTSIAMALDFFDRFMAFENVDAQAPGKPEYLDDLARARRASAAEVAKLRDFLNETDALTCMRCGGNRDIPSVHALQGADLILGNLTRLSRDYPLEKAVHHILRLVRKNPALKAALRPHRP